MATEETKESSPTEVPQISPHSQKVPSNEGDDDSEAAMNEGFLPIDELSVDTTQIIRVQSEVVTSSVEKSKSSSLLLQDELIQSAKMPFTK